MQNLLKNVHFSGRACLQFESPLDQLGICLPETNAQRWVGVNVLKLNLALNALSPTTPGNPSLDAAPDVSHQCITMKTTNIRELKHSTTTVLEWVAQGESVEITRRNKVVGIIVPPTPEKSEDVPSDYYERLEKLFYDPIQPMTGSEIVSYGRGER